MASYNNMADQRIIRWKALIMLVSFAASFTVFCHCETAAAATVSCCKRSCCEKNKKDDHGCQGMQAVKLNLQDKQTATAIHMAPLPMVVLPMTQFARVRQLAGPKAQSPDRPDRHSPPDRQSLYQCFII